jgi:hypothetical protein
MATIIEQLQTQLSQKGINPHTRIGQAWLLQKAKTLNPTPSSLFADRTALRARSMTGRMYFFFYSAKMQDTLPYWDRFPLVIPIERYPDGFLGLNLHYIPAKDRLVLLRKLGQHASGSLSDERTRFRLTYPILKATHSAYEATPCIKRYLFPHIKSRFLEIPATEWHLAAALPMQRFRGIQYTNDQEVWEESKENY